MQDLMKLLGDASIGNLSKCGALNIKRLDCNQYSALGCVVQGSCR